ncbi:MAG: hypothetical protein FWD57_08205 [Polyangiaceae bacterium]|nr:hypothetical protein [Polyangiaceae bacterium]
MITGGKFGWRWMEDIYPPVIGNSVFAIARMADPRVGKEVLAACFADPRLLIAFGKQQSPVSVVGRESIGDRRSCIVLHPRDWM